MSITSAEQMDWGIASMKKEIADFTYAFNRNQDFIEWHDDVYLLTKEAGTHTINQMWALFEKWEVEQV